MSDDKPITTSGRLGRHGSWVATAEGLKEHGLLDSEYDGVWRQLDAVHELAFRAGFAKGVFVGAAVVLVVGIAGWVL